MAPYELLTDIHALEEELLDFERKYGIRSETFYAAYMSGEEPEDDNWVLDLGSGPASIVPGWSDRKYPHHKHIPPDLKHHRVLAPDMSFDQLNLPFVIEEIEKPTPIK
ncbi:MAG TPA: hypothetical protein PKE20_00795 [Promineifilum sp.]|nr:hypothetical protein [Promineifilum sp.]